MARKKSHKEPILTIKGEARVACVNPDGTLAWRTPWIHNVITNTGFQSFLCQEIGSTTGSKRIKYMGLGTSTDAVATDATALVGEVSDTANAVTRQSFVVSVSASKTLQLLATFASGSDSFFSATGTGVALANVGLYDTNNSDGVMMCGLTYASQAVASNQQVNATYQLSFATA